MKLNETHKFLQILEGFSTEEIEHTPSAVLSLDEFNEAVRRGMFTLVIITVESDHIHC